ncbi:Vacuolar protein-sorting-associated protein 28 [Apiotrichum porosum]|uniref:Vacuolar protein sorting-associated protein 28 n=1 Tax=Apiotrichum porosum TaxID=105984 RepID=A0A427Y9L9_9TREE|nr:Vacuolar protein-sorting-associated protein 28 [Apiotrichum porosum]RSH87802.1 Vacuolar protein-sorting-associated protein 28 [Apiotrichum porosum]
MNLDEEVRLPTTPAERERTENLATLYSIVVSLEYLERAYVRDSVSSKEYEPACTRLLAQYKSVMKVVGEEIGGVETFMKRYRMDHPAALHRIQVGVPATVEHSAEAGGGGESGKYVAEATQAFITFMDALKLNLRAKDQLHPLLTEVMSGYAKFKGSAEWEGRAKIIHWLITLNAMKASDEITEEQSRQMLFDIENAYNEFFRSLSSGN